MKRRVTVEAPAKVNLRLVVLTREASGYHSLESVFCGISLSDRIDIRVSGEGVHLEVQGTTEMGPPEQNLVVRAARSFYAALGREPAIRIDLEKGIPVAAGLGGGSSNAAATLRALSALHDDPLPRGALLELGADLGSDVPFFLTSTPFALGWSRGERLLELNPLPPRAVLVAHPGIAMPTARAFQQLADLRAGAGRIRPNVISLHATSSWEGVRNIASNDFEPVAFDQIPILPLGIQALRDAGAQIALLSGSGASIFGIFAGEHERDAAEPALRALGMTTWRATTLTAWPSPSLQD